MFNAVVALGLALSMAQWAQADPTPRLSGGVLEHIAGTNPFDAIALGLSFSADEKAIGFSASPTADSKEMSDALAEFADPSAAIARIEDLKGRDHFSGGKVFAFFDYTEKGEFRLSCGISKSESEDWEEVRAKTTLPGSDLDSGSFVNFKLASRAERVRAIASCLAGMDGMPMLKTTAPKLTGMLIDRKSYALAENLFRSRGYLGTSGQYHSAFDCLVAETARNLPNAVGDTVVVKSNFSETLHSRVPAYTALIGRAYRIDVSTVVHEPSSALTVVNLATARTLFKAKSPDETIGIWAFSGGLVEDNALSKMLKPGISQFEACRQQAGLIDSRFSKGLVDQKPGCAHQ